MAPWQHDSMKGTEGIKRVGWGHASCGEMRTDEEKRKKEEKKKKQRRTPTKHTPTTAWREMRRSEHEEKGLAGGNEKLDRTRRTDDGELGGTAHDWPMKSCR